MSVRATRACWAVCAASGLCLLAAWLLPAGALHLEGYIGAGATQQSFSFARTVRFASDHSLASLVLPALGVALVGCAVLGVVWSRARPLFVLALVLAVLALIALDGAANFTDTGDGGSGVYSCDAATAEDPGACSGRLLRPALRRFAADVRAGPVGRRPGFTLNAGYRANRRVGPALAEGALVVALLVAAYASLRLVVRRWWVALLLLVAGTLAVLVWLFLRALSGLE
jgi:hypothetical protein